MAEDRGHRKQKGQLLGLLLDQSLGELELVDLLDELGVQDAQLLTVELVGHHVRPATLI